MSDVASNPLLALIQERELLDDMQLEEVSQELTRSGKAAIQVLQDFELLDIETILQVIADHLGTEVVDLSEMEISQDAIDAVPANTARMYQCLPIELFGSTLKIALTDPLNPGVVDEMGFLLHKEVQLVVADPAQIERLINSYYAEEEASEGYSDILKELGHDPGKGEEAVAQASQELPTMDLEDMEDQTPIIRFVNLVLYQAVQDRASDIHFEPFEEEFKIRYRVDGALYEMSPPPKHLAVPVTSRLKVMANLDIAERRLPQDGRISINLAGRPVDLRVSTLPTQFGESVVLRVLDRSAQTLEVENLGMPDHILDYVKHAVEQPNGILVVTGPTGSGKTTTEYSCLKRVNRVGSKLLTAEDPIEFDLEGIMQVAVNEGVGLTFAAALRSFLRQDPDIIMVGEMRDLETAQIAIQASLTGHLVLTTLHTNDSTGAVTRLVDMGVEPFLVSSTLMGVLAQRLVRMVCPKCRSPYEPTEHQLGLLNLSPHDLGEKAFYYGKGCSNCHHSGYKGRKGIYELLVNSEEVSELINDRSPAMVIRQKAVEQGMVTLREDGMRALFDGSTSVEEVLKYT